MAERQTDQIDMRIVRYAGYLILLIVIILMGLQIGGGLRSEFSEKFSSFVISGITLGVGLLVISELAPWVRSFSAGGISLAFGEEVSSKFLGLEDRIAKLERSLTQQSQHSDGHPAIETIRAPGLDKPIKFRNDRHKGRFGGKSSQSGFSLEASFSGSRLSKWVTVVLKVSADQSILISPTDFVEFHLHDTFNPEIMTVAFHDGVAELSLLAFGGFTVGVWIPTHLTELELDLSEMPNAPRVIREL